MTGMMGRDETPFAFLVPPSRCVAASGQIAFGFLEIVAMERIAIAAPSRWALRDGGMGDGRRVDGPMARKARVAGRRTLPQQ